MNEISVGDIKDTCALSKKSHKMLYIKWAELKLIKNLVRPWA